MVIKAMPTSAEPRPAIQPTWKQWAMVSFAQGGCFTSKFEKEKVALFRDESGTRSAALLESQ